MLFDSESKRVTADKRKGVVTVRNDGEEIHCIWTCDGVSDPVSI